MPVMSAIDIAEQGTINDLRIKVNISHTYIGDLRVDLVAPDGTAVVLHNNTGGSANDLVKTYSVRRAWPSARCWASRSRGRGSSVCAGICSASTSDASTVGVSWPGSLQRPLVPRVPYLAAGRHILSNQRKEVHEKEPAGRYAQP